MISKPKRHSLLGSFAKRSISLAHARVSPRGQRPRLAAGPPLGEGFLLLDPATIPSKEHGRAAAIGGLFKYGRPTPLHLAPMPDLLVVGSVAASLTGARVGKGEGYGEIEYALLRQLGRIAPETPIATTVHDLQVVESIPLEPFDVALDLIVTPGRSIEVSAHGPQPDRILWDFLPPEKIEGIPLLGALSSRLPRDP